MTALRAALLATSLLAASPSLAEAPPAAAPQSSAGAVPATPAPPAASAQAAPTQAAPAAREPAVIRFGVGAGIGTGGATPVLYLPLDAGPVRIELEGAYDKAGTSAVSATSARVGLGMFGLVPVAPATRLDAGVRVQYARDDLTGARASEAIRVAAALGGEWFPAPSVSLGVEGQVGYSAGLGAEVSRLNVSAQAILRVFLSTTKVSPSRSGGAAREGARPARLQKCQHSTDCERPDICFDGYCRH